MLEPADLYIWEGERKWRLPQGFDSKREFRTFLGKNDHIIVTSPHYSEKNGHHLDILQYGNNGKMWRKTHCKMDNHFGKSFVECLRKFLNMSERS